MPTVPERAAAASRELSALHEAVAGRLGEELAGLRAAAAGIAALDVAELQQLRDRCHRLAGTALTFGHESVGRQLQGLEGRLDAWLAEPTVPAADAVARGLTDLPVTLASPAVSLPIASPARVTSSPRLYLLEDDADTGELVRLSLSALGYDVRVFADGPGLSAAFECGAPDALLVNVRLGGERDGIEIATPLVKRTGIPLMVVTRHDDFAVRLRAIRQGACACFPKPIDLNALRRQFDRIVRPAEQPPYRVLLVDDDADVLAWHGTLLRSAGCEVLELTDPATALEATAQFRPELLIVDLNMPGCSGAELAAVIRLDDDFAHLPIVFLSAEQSWARQRDALVSGGDGFLPKPVAPDDFVALVTSRLRRAREVGQRVLRDSLTGLLQHGETKERLARELRLALRQGHRVAVAMIDIDRFKRVNDGYGHLVGDRVIQALAKTLEGSLRNTDLVGRYGGEEFLLAMVDATLEGARERLEAIRNEFGAITYAAGERRFRCTFSAGLTMQEAFDDCDAVIARADGALYRAKHDGRDRIVTVAGDAT